MIWLNSFKKNDSALLNLSTKISKSSVFCTNFFKSALEKRHGRDSKEFYLKYVSILLEFMSFFIHLTDRFTLGKIVLEKRHKLVNQLANFMVNVPFKTLFGHWPEILRDNINKDFDKSLYITSVEYSKYKKLFPEENENPKGTLFWEFSKNIARLSGYEDSIEVVLKCEEISTKEFVDMKFDELVDLVSKEI
jgi:hypothetical protein